MKTIKILFTTLSVLVLISCTVNNTSESSQYERTPFAVFVYDGNKEIVLYDNPQTATVNGQSGSWIETGMFDSHRVQDFVPDAATGGLYKTVYRVDYGSETLIISPGEELVFFGSFESAAQNKDNKSMWKECEKKRLY